MAFPAHLCIIAGLHLQLCRLPWNYHISAAEYRLTRWPAAIAKLSRVRHQF
jgi:hypothetical protein